VRSEAGLTVRLSGAQGTYFLQRQLDKGSLGETGRICPYPELS